MKYEDNRSGMDLLKKLFIKINKPAAKFFDLEHTKRLMSEIHGSLSEEQKKEYASWEEVEIFRIQFERERNKQ